MDNVCVCCSIPSLPNRSLLDMSTTFVKQITSEKAILLEVEHKVIDAYFLCSGIGRDDVNIGTKICTMCLEQLAAAYTFYTLNKAAQSLPLTEQTIKCVCCCSYSEQQVLYKVKTKTLNDDINLSEGFTTFFGRQPSSIEDNSRICKECFQQMESVFMFRELCKNGNEILKRKFLNSQPKKLLQEEIKDDEEDRFTSYDDGRVESDTKSSDEEIPLKVVETKKPIKVQAKQRKQPTRKKKEKTVQKVEKLRKSKRKTDKPTEKIVQTVEKKRLKVEDSKENAVVCQPQRLRRKVECKGPGKIEKIKKTEKKIDLKPKPRRSRKKKVKKEPKLKKLPQPEYYKPKNVRFECALCPETRTQKFDMKLHLFDVHFPEWGKQAFKCEFCWKMHMGRDVHERHLDKHRRIANGTFQKQFLCTLCGLSFETKSKIVYHMKSHPEKNQSFKCPQCPCKYTNELSMQRHVRKNHLNDSNRCSNCQKCFVKLERHRKICLIEKSYSCTTCDRSFKAPKELKLHQFDHLGYHPYNCPEMSADDVMCGYSSKKRIPFIYHLHKQHNIEYKETIHGMKQNIDLAKEIFAAKTIIRQRDCIYQCGQCGKSFQTQTGLFHHNKQHLKIAFQCKYCDKKFTQKPSLWDHSFTHRNFSPYNCKVVGCKYKSNTKKMYQVHLKRIHNEQYIESVHGYKLETFSQVMDFVLKQND